MKRKLHLSDFWGGFGCGIPKYTIINKDFRYFKTVINPSITNLILILMSWQTTNPYLTSYLYQKYLKKIVSNQICCFLNDNSVLETFQSGFRAKRSTESTLVKVFNDLLI